MSKKHEEYVSDEEPTLKYKAIMYGTFLTPPAILFCGFYFFSRNIFWSIIGTLASLVIGIILLALWWMKRTGKGVIVEE